MKNVWCERTNESLSHDLKDSLLPLFHLNSSSASYNSISSSSKPVASAQVPFHYITV